ncbi:hypothetical protein ACFU96_48080 [Streptomyces sp. NPDC057620]|uniref:hypothetical protein n=1 Tax=Streptomyces sp. NPDC057620 TaxID=3346185 RepID=UPI0036B1A578
MHHQTSDRNPALIELRRKLHSGLAKLGLQKQQLASQTHLGRTTVSEAFQTNGPVPSDKTVAALARALKLPVEELLELQRTAAASAGFVTADEVRLGKPIAEWEPHDLEVHPAAGLALDKSGRTTGRRVLPGYVGREHDRTLAAVIAQAAAGHSRMLVLIGTSSIGKTRACWEAIQPLAKSGWRLWHPFAPDRAGAALEDLHRVQPSTVVWLNEAQHYLGDLGAGESIAAALHHLLVQPERGPVLVLGTLWPEFADQYTALPIPGAADHHSRVRELLAGRTLHIPNAFDEQALAAAEALAQHGDRLLADALTRARAHGHLTQDLAGAPALLERYTQGHPAAKAILEAAMDARRLGIGLHLPQSFLTDAATDYLNDIDYEQLTEDWVQDAFITLNRPVHGKQAPLHRTTRRPERHPVGHVPSPTASTASVEPELRLADFLEQHGRTSRRHMCPPASFWYAAHTHLTHPDDLASITREAENRFRLQWANHLRIKAAEAGHSGALVYLARMRTQAGDAAGAEALGRFWWLLSGEVDQALGRAGAGHGAAA